MKVIHRTQPFFYEAFSRKTDPLVPEGRVRIRLVTFETIELEESALDDQTAFTVLDWNIPEMKAFRKGPPP